MAEYRYIAVDRGGNERSGTLAAPSRAEVAQRLEAGGLFAMEISEDAPAGSGLRQSPTSKGGGKVGRREVVVFARQLGDLLAAGITMDRALLILGEQTESQGMGAVIGGVRADVQAGRQLSDAMEAHGAVFPELLVRMVRAGEAGGQLDTVLDSAGRYLEADLNRRAQVAGAMVYPALLLGVSTLAVAFIVTFLIPRLTGMFEDMGQALPLPTVILMTASNGLLRYWYLAVALVVAVWAAFTAWRRTPSGALALDAMMLKAPVLGPITRALAMSRFARTLSALHKGGVSILDALDLVSDSLGNRVFRKALKDVREGVREGETIGAKLGATGVFPPLAIHMVSIGEESGNLEGLLSRLADIYDFEADSRLKKAMSLVEPGIILVMGVFIAFIIVAVLMPIFDLNASVSTG